jgi:hypothetical protein
MIVRRQNARDQYLIEVRTDQKDILSQNIFRATMSITPDAPILIGAASGTWQTRELHHQQWRIFEQFFLLTCAKNYLGSSFGDKSALFQEQYEAQAISQLIFLARDCLI